MRELPKSRGVLVYILLADMINSIIREIINLAIFNGGNKQIAAYVSVASFAVILVVFFGSLVLMDVIYTACKKTSANTNLRIALVIAQCLGVIFYFYGNNVASITNRFGQELRCGPQCVLMIRISAMISLGIALAYFQLVPPSLNKLAKIFNYEEKRTDMFSITRMIGIFIKVDALFNTVSLALEDVGVPCNKFRITIATAFFVICVLMGEVIMAIHLLLSMKYLRSQQGARTDNSSQQLVHTIIFFILFGCFPLYLLTDNEQPLQCAFNCSTGIVTTTSGSSNQTTLGSSTSCEGVRESGLRLGLTLLIFLLVSAISMPLARYKYTSDRKQLKEKFLMSYRKFRS